MTARTAAVTLALAAAACGGSPTSPSDSSGRSLERTIETASYEFRYSEGDSVDASWQEAYHAWAVAALQVSVPRRIRYNKYTSRQHMGSITGVYNTNGYANGELFEIHTLWPRDNHEVVHLYSSLFGRTVALWSEGLAVAFQTNPPAGDFVPKWSGTAVHEHARQFRAQGRLIPIGELLTTVDFRRFDGNVTYPQAGSFVKFVLDTCGLEGVKRVFQSTGQQDDAAAVRQQFQAACGQSLDAAEQAWLTMLAAG